MLDGAAGRRQLHPVDSWAGSTASLRTFACWGSLPEEGRSLPPRQPSALLFAAVFPFYLAFPPPSSLGVSLCAYIVRLSYVSSTFPLISLTQQS